MKKMDATNAEAHSGESAAPAASPPGNVVRLNVGLRRPAEDIQPRGQTGIGFTQPVPDEKAITLGKIEGMAKASFEEKNAGKPELLRWALEDRRKKEWARIEEEARASAFGRPAPAAPAAAKPAPKPKHPKGKDNRQATLPFDAARPPTGQAGNDPENEPLEVEARARLSMKDELLAMELPLFALSKTPDLKPRTFRRRNGCGQVRIIPSGCGPATVFDNDLVIYCASVIDDLVGRGLTPSRTLVVDTADFLRKTGRGHGGKDYESVANMLRRLLGTIIETDIPTNGVRQTEGFTIIQGYKILWEKERVGKRKNKKTGREETYLITSVLRFSITLSEWQYNSIRHEKNHVLTIDNAYFELDSAVERRLCQIARHHCGGQPLWKVDIGHLADKVGTRGELRKFREDIRNAIRDDRLPGYHVALDSQAKPNKVVFYRKTEGLKDKEKDEINRARSDELLRLSKDGLNAFEWFESLEKPGSEAIKPRASSAERRQRQNQEAAARKEAKQSGTSRACDLGPDDE